MPPAARITDPTTHGAPLSPGPGSPNVMIGGQPAWLAIIDQHACPAVSITGADGVGSVLMGSPTVFINGQMACRMGDIVVEKPGLAMGPMNPIIMGCPTVIIGEIGTPSSITPDIAQVSFSVLNQATTAEPVLTATLKDLASSVGAEMAGLQFRIKSYDSMARKIADDAAEKNVSAAIAAENIGDALRYTMIFDEDRYSAGSIAVLSDLEAKGHKVLKLKNTWREGAPYKGINVNVATPEGQKYEIQFHTPESFEMKQKLHSLYEECRAGTTGIAKQQQLLDEMRNESAQLNTPAGVQNIKNR